MEIWAVIHGTSDQVRSLVVGHHLRAIARKPVTHIGATRICVFCRVPAGIGFVSSLHSSLIISRVNWIWYQGDFHAMTTQRLAEYLICQNLTGTGRCKQIEVSVYTYIWSTKGVFQPSPFLAISVFSLHSVILYPSFDYSSISPLPSHL